MPATTAEHPILWMVSKDALLILLNVNVPFIFFLKLSILFILKNLIVTKIIVKIKILLQCSDSIKNIFFSTILTKIAVKVTKVTLIKFHIVK